MQEKYSPNINVMMKAARNASRSLVRDFGEVENLQVSQKGPRDFVSNADMKAERAIIKELQRAKPDYPILSEESGDIAGSDEDYRWIIDPLDGTTNFLHGVPLFCVTIALEKKMLNGKREIIAAVTESPVQREVFWAEKNKGAWLESNDSSGMVRMRVSGRKKLDTSLLGIGSYMTDLKEAKSVPTEVCAVRCIGSTALGLAYVAAGRYDSFLHIGCHPWDIAAGMLMIREAGGQVSDIKGKDKMFDTRTVVAANEDVHHKVMRSIRG